MHPSQQKLKGLISPDDFLAVFIKRLAFAREPEFFFAPLDERRLEKTLQRADLLADGGLRDVVDLRGLRETFRFRQIAKDFETLNLHKKN